MQECASGNLKNRTEDTNVYFAVPDMSYGHCTSAIEKAINAVDAKATIQFDMDTRRIEVTSAVANADLSALLEKKSTPIP